MIQSNSSGLFNLQQNKNRKKLIQQNKKLHKQVTIVKDELEKIKEISQNNPQIFISNAKEELLKETINKQEKKIKKIKCQLDNLRIINPQNNSIYIINEENQITVLKKQLQKLKIEKNIRIKQRNDKILHLKSNQIFKKHQKTIQQQLTQSIKINKNMAIKIIKLQKKIRKYHLAHQNHLDIKKQQIYPGFKYAQLQKQYKIQLEKIQKLQEKWKPGLRKFDQEYWQFLKQSHMIKQKLYATQSEETTWNIRMSAIRQANKIQQCKERVAKLTLSLKLQEQLKKQIQKQNKIGKRQKKMKKIKVEDLKFHYSNQESDDNYQAKNELIQIENMEDDKNIVKISKKDDNNILLDKGIVTKKQNQLIQFSQNSQQQPLQRKQIKIITQKDKKIPSKQHHNIKLHQKQQKSSSSTSQNNSNKLRAKGLIQKKIWIENNDKRSRGEQRSPKKWIIQQKSIENTNQQNLLMTNIGTQSIDPPINPKKRLLKNIGINVVS